MRKVSLIFGAILLVALLAFAVPSMHTGIASEDTREITQKEGDTDTLTAGVEIETLEINDSDTATINIESDTQSKVVEVNDIDTTNVSLGGVDYSIIVTDFSNNGKSVTYHITYNNLADRNSYAIIQYIPYLVMVSVVLFLLTGAVKGVAK